MSFSAVFRCSAGCEWTSSLDTVVYRCGQCGGLVEIEHDVAALAARPAAAWKALFAERWRGAGRDGSGVWGKREWVQPHLAAEHVVTLGEGGSPLLALPRYSDELGVGAVHLKQCGITHTGSFKDLGMTVLVSTVKQLIAAGHAIPAIACASTGDTSAALAAYAAAAGIRALVLLPRGKISPAQLVQPLAAGARVFAVDSDFDGCMAIMTQLAANDGVYLANSMNPLRLEGQKTVAFEIAQQLGWRVPDWVIVPGGNLGNVAALAAGFAMLRDLGLVDGAPRLCVAQAAGANPLVKSYRAGWAPLQPITAAATAASAIQIGNPVSFPRAVRWLKATRGVAVEASEAQLADAAARADRHGLFNDPHTGVALAALEQLTAGGQIGKADQVVVISTASGLKFADFKIAYHAGNLAGVPAGRYRNQPIDVANDYAAVRELVRRELAR